MKKFTKLFLVFVLGLAIVLPMQVSNIKAAEPQGPRTYFIGTFITYADIFQARIDVLCPKPAVFSWLDNGVPEHALRYASNSRWFFNSQRVTDAGKSVVDSGYHFHKFYAELNDGRKVAFWACVDRDNNTSRCNNCLGNLLYDY